jgi:D-alanyl-D-alanine carboxypeptidase (penicillin-binding protein 5/6)
VSQSVLQGGVRRRRAHQPLILLLVLLAGGAGLGTWLGLARGSRPAIAAARTPVPAYNAGKLAPVRVPRSLVAVRRLVARTGLELSARAAILVDGRSGTVLWAKREHERLPIASTTKIMTAAVAMGRLAPKDLVRIDPSVPRVAPFREGLRAGERVPAWKLFYGLMLYSGNDDALALAIGAAGSRPAFLGLMNTRARELGLKSTHFTSPSGVVDRGNYSTAWDLATITRYALLNPRFRTVVGTRVKRVRWSAPTYSKVYVNKNHLLGSYAGADGVKTGWTTLASHCLVASAQRHGVRLVAVVLRSGDPYGDMRRLLDYGFATRG